MYPALYQTSTFVLGGIVMPQELPPAVRRFQQIKAARKAAKIRELQAITNIKATTPTLTDKQALQVYQASEAQKAREQRLNYRGRTIQVTRV
jgi:hypothetical protein